MIWVGGVGPDAALLIRSVVPEVYGGAGHCEDAMRTYQLAAFIAARTHQGDQPRIDGQLRIIGSDSVVIPGQ